MQNAGMSKSITVRNVPDKTRDELAARAALKGQSLQAYLRGQLIRLAERVDAEVWLARVTAEAEREGLTFTADEILSLRDADRR